VPAVDLHREGEEVNKYNARKTQVGNLVFDSGAEARHYNDLLLMFAAGEITDLERQIVYPLVVNGVKVATYIADFRYTDVVSGAQIVVDVKGYRKGAAYSMFRLKKKLVYALYNVDVIEVT
jgi:hypothetical protein